MNARPLPTPRVLVVDDEASLRTVISMLVKSEGCDVSTASSGEEVFELLASGERYALVITDLRMNEVGGLDVLRAVKELDPSCQVLVMTAYASASTAVEAMREGAYDYLIKPVKMEDARASIRRALEKNSLLHENISLKEELKHQRGFGEMLGRSGAIQQVFDLIRRVAPTSTRVLITGESGTGKELVARSIHEHSAVSSGPFLPINCGAIPAHLIESELFGYKRGAFTGATSDKKGLFEAASGGTVFLDEIGEMPLETQVRFLRVLESMKVRPVGATSEVPLDCRIIAATNKNLHDEIAEGTFREDLYYRLNTITIELPALREREGDIELLVRHFLDLYASEQNRTIARIDPEALHSLLSYDYPGNVRELQNVMQRAVTLCRDDVITPDVLSPQVLRHAPVIPVAKPNFPEEGIDLEALVERFERRLIAQALERTGGVKKDAARLLGISYRAMRHRLSKYGID